MYVLRLFHNNEPDRPISAHMLAQGRTRVGRDPDSEWPIADPDCEVSRIHFEIRCDGQVLLLTPLGANGVYRSDNGARLPDGCETQVSPGDMLRFGKFHVGIEDAPFAGRAAPLPEATMVFATPFGDNVTVPRDWSDAATPPEIEDEDSLLEAFCNGAGLDVSAMSAEDPVELMRCAGAIYRQMVLGLGDLVRARSATKSDLNLDRTTIGARDNNPFKWAPTRKLAAGLLAGREQGFLSGPEAIRESFGDVKKHMLGTLAGFGAAIDGLVGTLSPEQIEMRLEGQTHFLKSRSTAAWEGYRLIHAELRQRLGAGGDAALNQAFMTAYENKVAELNAVQQHDEAHPGGTGRPV